MKWWVKVLVSIGVITVIWWVFSDSADYSVSKYQKYKADAELSDAVHEWIGDYVERYCYAVPPERGETRVRLKCD